jgi:hypothetical protein
VFAGGIVLVVAFDQGGYFATSWGPYAMGVWAVCGLALAFATPTLSRPLAVFLSLAIAFVVWKAVSVTWTRSVPRTVAELQRDLLVVASLMTCALLHRTRGVHRLVIGLCVSLGIVAVYSLWDRLLVDGGHATAGPSQRLTGPLGYWNALALVSVLAMLLALGVAASSSRWQLTHAAAGAIPMLAATLYLTFGRAAWIALGVGFVVGMCVARERLRLAVTAVSLAPWVAIAVWAISREGTSPTAWSHGQISVLILATAGVATFAPSVSGRLHPRLGAVRVPRLLRAVMLLGGGATAVIALAISHPVSLFEDAHDSFTSSVPSDLSVRLVSLSGSGRADYWRIAWDDWKEHPWGGSGAGTYELAWNEQRPNSFGARDAHNLYLETLEEVGPFGLAILLGALALPLLALRRKRVSSICAGAAAAYVAFLLHAASDWDWEMPAVTIAALLCGCALLLERGSRPPVRLSTQARSAAVAAVVVVFAFAFDAMVGNGATAASARSAARGDYVEAAAQARKAIRWSPWASEPWRLLAAAQLADRRVTEARASLRTSIAHDPNDWLGWSQLLPLTRGPERLHALSRITKLNPEAVGMRGHG